MLLLPESAFTWSGQWCRQNTNEPLRLQLFFNGSLCDFTGCAHDLMPESGLPSFFSVPGNTKMGQSMLGTSSTDDGSVIQSTHWYTIWVGHNSPREFTQDALTPHYIWITTFMNFIPISPKASSNGTPTIVTKDTDIFGSQSTYMITVLPWLVGSPINLAGIRFTTGTDLSAYILSFVNITTDRWSTLYFTITECASNVTSADGFST